MKYVSLDIETTGLDHTIDDILEVGAIFDDLRGPVIDHQNFRCVIVNNEGRYTTTPYCATLHQALWEEIQEASKAFEKISSEYNESGNWDDFECGHAQGTVLWNNERQTWYCRPEMLGWCFFQWISQFGFKPGDRINVAGKNVALFDIPFMSEPPYLFLETCQVGIRHRVIDPSILFFRPGEDDELPNMETCLERAGLSLSAHHHALGDALDVVRLLRYTFNQNP